ncbi:hypothetical protein ACFLSF_04195 [Candidatus Bipolaricaulota bacterium]
MRVLTIAWIAAVLIGEPVIAELPDLSGTWAMAQVFPQIAILPIAGEVFRSSTVVQFVDIEQDGSAITMLDRYCFTVVNDGTPLVTTKIPDEFMASLVPTTRTAVLRETDAGISFEQPTYVEVRGAALSDPLAEALPIDPLDPRVIDQDGDGQPGMTVRVTILGIIQGETYVVQRVQYRLSGWVVDPDRIEGRIEWIDEQSVLAATNSLLETDTIGVPDPDPAAHRFVMVRVDLQSTCDELRDRLEEILGEPESD